MSPRKRSAGRQGWPDNLYPNRDGFKYRHPITRRETFMGRDKAKAFVAAKKLNAMLLPGNDLVDKVIGSRETVADAIAVFRRDDVPGRNWAPKTAEVYESVIRRTEAGIGSKGIVASSAALAVLLQEGIGDTIRISLTPEPGQSRTAEVIVAQELLQTTGQRAFTPLVTACPGCGRTTSEFFQELAKVVQNHVREKMPIWKVSHPGAESMTLAVMGCIVNGPGESRHANIGISLPGTGETPAAPVFVDGEKTVTLRGENIAQDFVALIDDYVERTYVRTIG